jgi:hypothetical protein
VEKQFDNRLLLKVLSFGAFGMSIFHTWVTSANGLPPSLSSGIWGFLGLLGVAVLNAFNSQERRIRQLEEQLRNRSRHG